MPTLSIVINCDTRPQNDYAEHMFRGTVNADYLIDGIGNKIKFFDGFDKEIIVCVDEHAPIPEAALNYLNRIADTLLIRRHTHEEKFNDWNYWRALAMASGDIIFKFDQDCATFTSGQEPINQLISLLDKYDYVSYPSHWSPDPVHDPNYDYFWCSTRFFLCKRETLDFTEIKKCLLDSDYLYGKYPTSVRNPWFEHITALISKYTGKGVYYPPMDLENYAIFSWRNYKTGTLEMLNNMSYSEIRTWLQSHPISYPNDVDA
jgi:hypothetical protein